MNLYVVIIATDYSLSNGTVCTLEAYDGLGLVPLHRLTSRGPMQHGDWDLGFRMDPRVFSLRFGVHGSSRADLDGRLETLLGYLSPDRDIEFKFVLDNTNERSIVCQRIGMTIPHDAQRHWEALPVGAQFSAADPRFYDPTYNKWSLTWSGSGDMDETQTLTYNGSVTEWPYQVKISGPITDPVVTNTDTQDKLDFTGITIGAGHYYEIDCRYGYKTVEDDAGTNVVDELTDDSDLASFHLGAEPEVEDGENDIQITGSGTTAATDLDIQWYDRFAGLWG